MSLRKGYVRTTLVFALLVCWSAGALAQSGKIAGRVTDAATDEPIPGVNVVVEGTTIGATTDPEGYYTILQVPPGTYTVRASFVGYAPQAVQGLEVNIDLTTTYDFELQEETVGLQEVTVQAVQPVVKPDISANVANISPEDFVHMPVAGVADVVSLQAGIEPGLSVRGGGVDELSFVVDGASMRTGRDNQPFTSISYTSVAEMQVQTGGFSAEYGNVRSGLINVVTKEAPRDRYTFDALVRYQPAQAKNFGGLPEDDESYFKKQFVPEANRSWLGEPIPSDMNPAFVGSANSVWDVYERRQYGGDFVGWNTVANQLATDEDPSNDLTPAQLVDIFQFRTRKENEITIPDYVADVTLGGPLVPGFSDHLGDLRFLASYRRNQTSYLFPQQREGYEEQTGQLKVTTNFAPGAKLTLQGMLTQQRGMNEGHGGGYGAVAMYSGWMPTYPWGWVPPILTPNDERAETVFSPSAYALANVDHVMAGGEITHTLGANTFYKARLQRMGSTYRSKIPNRRDLTRNAFCVDGTADQQLRTPGRGDENVYCVDEAPFGFAGQGGNILGAGYTTGGHWVYTRDTTDVAVWTGEFDLTSQVNRFMQIKTGVDFWYNDYDIRWGAVNLALGGQAQGERHLYNRNPIQGAFYAQNKLEFQGLITNIGLRLDYMDVNTDWWVYDPWPRAFSQRVPGLNAELDTEPTEANVALSPRLGVSFPVTEDSKLYFNYGHFRNMLDPEDLFGVQQSLQGGIDDIGNPNHPMPKTVAYELGYDQNLFDMFLLRISGYYRDVRNQPRDVLFTNLDGSVEYTSFFPWNYEDIRGAEFTLTKTRGDWVRGFANYTFMSTKEGNFGFQQFNQNTFQQRQYLRTSTDYRLNLPIPQPFARVSLEFLVPDEFGPALGRVHPLGDWRLNLLGEWRDGETFTWTAGSGSLLQNVQNNVDWVDYWNLDLRLTKNVAVGAGDVQLFADISNVLNLRRIFRNTAFVGNRDEFFYMSSLHLPGDIFGDEQAPYMWIHGDDQPGDFRKPGVEFQPVEVVLDLDDAPQRAKDSPRAWVYEKDSEDYYRWTGSEFVEVDDGAVDEMLDDKAYIDMPNSTFSTFLRPRQVLFGVRVGF